MIVNMDKVYAPVAYVQ